MLSVQVVYTYTAARTVVDICQIFASPGCIAFIPSRRDTSDLTKSWNTVVGEPRGRINRRGAMTCYYMAFGEWCGNRFGIYN